METVSWGDPGTRPFVRLRMCIAAVGLVLAICGAHAQTTDTNAITALTFTDAMRIAETRHPAVRLLEAQLASADGLRREADSVLANNPELNVERTRRRSVAPDARADEWSVGISQPIEVAGQQGHRRSAAAARLDALRAEIDDARQEARAEAALRFHAVLVAQRRVQIEQRSVDLFEGTAQAVARRRAAGEDTRLDANVALVEAQRARNAVAAANDRWLDARAELASALQLPPERLPDVAGELTTSSVETSTYALVDLLAAARARPKTRALASREAGARARLDVERASRIPDVTVGLSVGREGPADVRERVTMISLSVPLPFFKRNEAAVGQALSDVQQAEIDRNVSLRDIESRVRRLWARLASQRERALRLQRSLMPAATDNQQLAAKSRQAGQIGLLDQLVVNRQALDAERELAEALSDYHETRIELEQAAGWSQGLSR